MMSHLNQTTVSSDAIAARAANDSGDALIERALAEFPLLHRLSERFQTTKPLTGARIAALCPVTIHSGALLYALMKLGARIRWAAGGDGEVDESLATTLTASGWAIFGRRGQSAEEHWNNIHRVFDWYDGGTPNLILDMDGEAASLIHQGVFAEAGSMGKSRANPGSDETAPVRVSIRRRLAIRPGFYSAIATNISGLSECTAHGVERLRQIEKAEGLMFPVIDASRGGLAGHAPDRDRIATDTLAGLLAMQALALVELYCNGKSYAPGVHRFPTSLRQSLSDLDVAMSPAKIAGTPA